MAIEQSFIPIGETGEKLDSVRVDTPAGADLHRETVVAADPENPDGLGRVVNTEPAADVYAAAVRAVGVNAKLDSLIAKPAQLDALTDAQLRASPVPVTTGGLTDAQLRASPVNVATGGLTDAQLRASPVDFLDANTTGAWGYRSGVSGTVAVPAGRRVLQITATAGATDATLTINGGDTVTIPAYRALTIEPKGNLVAPSVVFTGTTAYFIEDVA